MGINTFFFFFPHELITSHPSFRLFFLYIYIVDWVLFVRILYLLCSQGCNRRASRCFFQDVFFFPLKLITSHLSSSVYSEQLSFVCMFCLLICQACKRRASTRFSAQTDPFSSLILSPSCGEQLFPACKFYLLCYQSFKREHLAGFYSTQTDSFS